MKHLIYILFGMTILLTGCQTAHQPQYQVRPVTIDEPTSNTAQFVDYYNRISLFSSADLAREKALLLPVPSSPSSKMKLALLFYHPKGLHDAERAKKLLEDIQKSTDSLQASLRELARFLLTQLNEREKLITQTEKLSLQLNESNRANNELQKKLEALKAIDRSLNSTATLPRARTTLQK